MYTYIKENIKIFTLIMYIIASLFRIPDILFQKGRFLFEDGSIFFSYAWHFHALDALFRSFAGYLNLPTNAVTLLAARLIQHNLCSILLAPAIVCFFALIFQTLPALILLYGKADWLNSNSIRIAAIAVIALTPLSEESWLNIMHAQLWLTLCCALILVCTPPQKWYSWLGHGFILFLAPLSGMAALLLGPIFLCKCLIERSWPRFYQTTILGCASLLQICCFYTPNPIRHFITDISVPLVILFVRMECVATIGVLSRWIGKLAEFSYNSQGVVHFISWYGLLLISILGSYILLKFIWTTRNSPSIWLILSGFIIGLFSYTAGMSLSDPKTDFFQPRIGEHYNFLPTVLLGLSLLIVSQGTLSPSSKKWRKCFLALFFTSGLISYALPCHSYVNRHAVWSTEAHAWEYDHNYFPQTWYNTRIDLSERSTPCPPPTTTHPASINTPQYCDAFWLLLMEQKNWGELKIPTKAVDSSPQLNGNSLPPQEPKRQ